MKRAIATLAGLALSGCMVGPDYASPAARQPAQTPFVGANDPAFVPAPPPAEWWKLFNAPILDRLVADAVAANTDLRVAAANLRQARAVLRESRNARLPTTNLSASGNYGQQSGAGFGQSGPLYRGETYDAGLDVGYQIDLFGRIARAIEASRADVDAVAATYDLTRITVVAETIRAYAEACSTGNQLNVARESLRVQEETFDLTRRLFEGGRGTALDTSRASALLEQTRADIPTLEATRRAALFRLAVLTGRPPAEFPAEVAACTTPPTTTSPIPVGEGTTLLARRPDVRAAERRLAAATARIGVATADLYPSISLGGSIGSTATSIGDLFSNSGFRFGLGPLISWTFPNTGLARARIAQAEAATEAALAQFDGAWLGALQETETALTRYTAEGSRVATLLRARDASAEAARIARLRYQAGAETFQIVLDAERSLAASEALLAQSRAQFSDLTITLFLALGGGWEAQAPPAN
ncbi:efflux transporter outer membrane subunit [Sphingomonas sp. M1-B02]|uniref:efflux transporter outer membrane subunit n=1 Tax=Sphingomonas sp. M1-B02 TaxID=3114300 RepID=UPI002AD265B3|nr:efflux transporter outer membrane subunit [Sphingomonas sp. S6-11]